ncbi:helix-turn-helix transcriptional regulator [Lacrimispora sp.]|uniref:helix-turn-helix transcriptional regulator n=1 Tax=Lacrimispora sp. TaxID=2719234 RepID=UPI0028AFF4E2|nr:helix-turn-helix transcriptional regulator [Lacrimispora sp.]
MKDVNKTVVENKKRNAKLTRENQTKYCKEVEPISVNGYQITMWKRFEDLLKSTGDKLEFVAKKSGYKDASSFSRARSNNSKLSIANVIKIAKFFNVSTDYLLGLTSFKNPNNMEETEQLEHIFQCLISTMLNFLPEDRRQPFIEKLMQDNK